jgi:hypothetical protein
MNLNLEETKTKAKSIFKKAMWLSLLALVLFSVGYYFYRNYTLSEGTRTGLLFKISKRGKIFKTYEGQLQLAGSTFMNKESIWDFSVADENVYQSMQNLEGKNVRLHYRQVVDAFVWQGDSDYLIEKVEEIK